ncbi:hypothetical protein HE1_00321 [Holospora elegans E1]|uniref:Uncharacterized protein n=1 Tax=Holospora elegans E1 TaxID=1427503 RepID=A0A023DXB5_9PROT|nr:hypothetical protein HE1_00321 [Holospora elegans E1]
MHLNAPFLLLLFGYICLCYKVQDQMNVAHMVILLWLELIGRANNAPQSPFLFPP